MMVMRTYSCVAPKEIIPFCEAMGELWGWCERCLYKDILRGHSVTLLKKEYQVKYGISARQFNSIYQNLRGKIQSTNSCRKREIEKLQSRITELEKSLKKLTRKIDPKLKDKRVKKVYHCCRIKANKRTEANQLLEAIHNKKRKQEKLIRKLEKLKSSPATLIFGGRKLWKKQYNLDANGYGNHEEWLWDWRGARSNCFVFVGSKDEKCGNQICQLDSLGNLKIRVPYRLMSEFGTYKTIELPHFRYGQKEIEYALRWGKAMTYRFTRKKGNWYVHISFDVPSPPRQSSQKNGVLGIDLNPSVIGWAVCNAEGNLQEKGQIRINVRDKSSNQTRSILGDAVSFLVKIASKYQCPISIEKLDFRKKKAAMKEMGVKYSRMLSSFAYHKFAELLFSRADKDGIQVISINPAYSSLIGLSKFLTRYGLSSDTAAALVLARRALWLSERPPADYARLVQADTNRHVWSFWRKLSKKLRGVSRHSFFGESVTNSESEVNLLDELSDNRLDELSDNRFKGKPEGTSDNWRDSGSRIVGKAVRPAS